MDLPDILPPPRRPSNVSENAQWLSGEGAGSWFDFAPVDTVDCVYIQRYSDVGILECASLFRSDAPLHLETPFQITYPSHCQKVTVVQQGKRIQLKAIKNETLAR
ncbi:MAG: hypothetical protein JJ975_04230 [Bacteroidia bacterium]|nr:hypothetical protein [Bacteroidia bacterium]